MRSNPLSAPIARILHATPQGLSEYELLSQLRFAGLDLEQGLADDANLRLFRKHFLVMNGLYQLQPVLWEQGLYLSISALLIKLEPVERQSVDQQGSGGGVSLPDPAGEQAIRDYYLDWDEFDQSSSESVQQLLDRFWQRYFADDQQQDALALLQLGEHCSWDDIRTRYRRLAAMHHPDRGGDSDRFRQVREAYELLACCRR